MDVEITNEITISEPKKHIDQYEDMCLQSDLRKLSVPVKWTWSRVQKVCGASTKQHIEGTLAKEARLRRHHRWMDKYTECETLGMKPADNRKIITVARAEVSRCFKEPNDKAVEWQRLRYNQGLHSQILVKLTHPTLVGVD